jgi:hypothetical protein
MTRPRNIAGPVVRGPDLWGRADEVAHLRQLLRRGSVLLTGPRRHGKSSLMYALLDSPESGCTVILLDVEWVETPEEFLTTMAAELLAIDRIRQITSKLRATPSALARWISGVLDEVGVGLENVGELKIRLRERMGNGDQWPQLAEQMLGTLRALDDRVILVLDEFPIMVGNMLDSDTGVGVRFLRWFRTFRQSSGTERLTFLLGGSTNIEPRLEAIGAEILLGDLQRFRITAFDQDVALLFVREVLTEEKVACEDGVVQEVLAVCGSGVPYYLQVILAECLAESRRSKRQLRVSDIRRIYEERVIGPVNRHLFSHYHTRLRHHYASLEEAARVVLGALCTGPKSGAELYDLLQSSGRDPTVLERLLVLLEADYYVLRSGDVWRFSDGLLSDWWSRNSVPPKVRQ